MLPVSAEVVNENHVIIPEDQTLEIWHDCKTPGGLWTNVKPKSDLLFVFFQSDQACLKWPEIPRFRGVFIYTWISSPLPLTIRSLLYPCLSGAPVLIVIRLSSGSFSCPEQEDLLSVQPLACPVYILRSTGNISVVLRAALGSSSCWHTELPIHLDGHMLQTDIALIV